MRLLRRLIALSKDGRLGGAAATSAGAGAAPAPWPAPGSSWSSWAAATAAALPPPPVIARPRAAVALAAAAPARPTLPSSSSSFPASAAAGTSALLTTTRGFAADAAAARRRRPAYQDDDDPQQPASLEELVALAEGVAERLAPSVARERASGNGGGRRRRLRQRGGRAPPGDNVYKYPHPVSYYAPVRLPVHSLGGGVPLPPPCADAASAPSAAAPTTPTPSPAAVVVGRAELPGDVFAVPVRLDVLHRVVRWQMAARQQGTHKVKDRSEVSGGGRKPWRQKGTGRARQGSIRAPQWRGGGIVHGPHPRSHAHRLPKKVRRLGLKCALSAKAAEGRLLLVDTLNPVAAAAAAGTGAAGAPPKTRVLAAQLAALLAGQPRRSVLLVDAGKGDDGDGGSALRRAARNLPGADVVPARGANVRSILRRDVLVLTPAAAAALAARLRAPVNRLGASGRTQARRVLALRAAQARAAAAAAAGEGAEEAT